MSTTEMPAAESRRLTRSRDDRIVAGVCGGAARYFDIDPVIPRILLAVLAVFGGAGLVVYALAWLLIPEDGAPATRVERWLERRGGDRSRDLVIVIVALVALSFLFNPSPFAHRLSGAAFVVIVVMAVAALARRGRARRTASVAPTAAMPVADAGLAPDARGVAERAVPQPAATPRERSWLGWLTLGVTLLVAGAFSIAALAGWAHPQPADAIAACLAVVGIGILAGAVVGRAWSMIPVGIVLVVALGVADALPRDLTWTAGDRHWTPIVAGAPAPYVLGAGTARLDLSQLPSHRNATITGKVGAGRLIVTLPPGDVVNIHATASAGHVDILGDRQDGAGLDLRQAVASATRSPGVVTLNLQMGFGDVEVRHAAA